jgi:7-cyano-7-deazaguanine synthase
MSVVLLSGGLDSAVLLAHVIEAVGGEVRTLSVGYGQRHERAEMHAAHEIATRYKVPRVRVDLPPVMFDGSTLTGGVGQLSGSPTVVPGRNLVFLSLAVAHAASVGSGAVYLASHKSDEAVYPDCRASFVAAVGAAAELAYGVMVAAPFLGMTKREVVARGRELGVPLEMTWSCYAGGSEPCGACGACDERTEALA